MEFKSSKKDMKIMLKSLIANSDELDILKCKLNKNGIIGCIKKDDDNIKDETFFSINYKKHNFLRLYTFGGLYDYKLKVLESIGIFLSEENGLPIAFYNIRNNNSYNPYLEWCLDKKEKDNYIKELSYDTLYDDQNICGLILLEKNERSLEEKLNEIKSMMMLKGIRR